MFMEESHDDISHIRGLLDHNFFVALDKICPL